MIVKKRNKWEVRDSSGKKVLGTHNKKEDAIKQLAAIEISKKKRAVKEDKETLNNFMNSYRDYEKLRCARLSEIKKALLEQYAVNKALIEAYGMAQSTIDGEEETPDQPQFIMAPNAAGQQQQQGQEQYATKTARRRRKEEEQANSEDNTDTPDPFQKAQAHHGIALTPQMASAQQNILQTHYDNPSTEEEEIADEPTWQNVNQSVSNYMGAQVNKLLKQQGMIG